MKLKYATLLILLVMTSFAKGQQIEYSQVITYLTSLNWTHPGFYTSVLYIGGDESCFILMGIQNTESKINDKSDKFLIKIGTKYPDFYLKKYGDNHILFLGQLLQKDYLVKDSFSIKWKILEQSKKIGNYLCRKAVCSFRGRKYAVWFSKEIPLSLGPWKLTGLPGLVFEAVDSTKEVSFKLISIKNQSGSFNLNMPRINAITWHEYKKLFQKSNNRFISYFKTFENENVQVSVAKMHLLEPALMKDEK
jgi:GLPGLI family protein